MNKFIHGGDIESFAKNLKCSKNKIIDLSSNINFVRPKTNFYLSNLEISSYPNYNNIYKSISKLYNIKKEELELFNGGSSAIFNLFNILNLKYCTIYSPAYLEYKKASEIFDYKTIHINRFENIYKKIKKRSFVIFVNPSTPDGKYYNQSIVKKLFKKWKKADATVLIDESFLQFTNNGSSAIKYLKIYKKLYILKSMTKIYSSAGIRIGAVISNKRNIKNIKQKQPAWKLSQYDIVYLQKSINSVGFIKKSLQANIEAKSYLHNILKRSKYIKKIYRSDANFILVKLKNITAEQFQNRLKSYKIMIRNCSNFDFLNNKYVRIAVKDIKKLKKLKKAIVNEKY